MTTRFAGFPAEAMQFFRGLARNNNRDWFLPRKPVFEENVKRPMWELVEALNVALQDFAPEYVTDPARAIYRFYRDTRFSKDKSPYKDRIAASFPRRGLKAEGGAGLYLSISHKEVAFGGGAYMPTPDTLRAIRQHLGEEHEEFRRILAARPVQKLYGNLQGEQLSRVPKGFPKDHPAGDLIRYKQFLLYVELSPEIATQPRLLTSAKEHFLAMKPFVEFLNAPLLEAQRSKKRDPRNSFLP